LYNSHWFDGHLIFFGFNLLCCTIRRFKRKLSQIGFITTHIGVMVILIGGLMSMNMKLEGQLIIPEGEARNYLLLDSNVFRASVEQGGNMI
jgi:cytochrome c biogenesis protein ResB